jgi:hypothetical protein
LDGDEDALIKIRIDVDYPYPSRVKSFICTMLGIKIKKDYMKNSKILARMINRSPEEVKAYWFFTPKTLPDRELMRLLNNSKHEIALHIVNDPYRELKLLEKTTGKKINYYTIHGTARLLARVMWKRWRTKAPVIPNDFPPQSFHSFPTLGLDILCHSQPTEEASKITRKYIEKGYVLQIHPIWLFQRGKLNFRGPFHETIRRILGVDGELETITLQKKIFFTMAKDAMEYGRDIAPTDELILKLTEIGADVFTFIERRWTSVISSPSKSWVKANDNIALLRVSSYDEWWGRIGKKTRYMVRKAEKSRITVKTVEPDERLAEGIWRIYNETPIRQNRFFPPYGISLQTVKRYVLSSQNSTYIGAFFEDELVGFIRLLHGDNITIISQILSLQKHWDKAINNALIAKAVEFCASRHIQWLMYGRMGNHPSLDQFKRNNGFEQFRLTRYYIPLTKKGRMAIKLGLHREIEDVLPPMIKYPLIPLYNWVSRTKAKIRLLLKPRRITSL